MNLATDYLGLHLRSPIIPSAGPLTENLDNVKRMEDTQTGVCHISLFFRNRNQAFMHPSLRKAHLLILKCDPPVFSIPPVLLMAETSA